MVGDGNGCPAWVHLLKQPNTGRIARSNIDGTGVNQSFITGASTPAGVALDKRYVYWSNNGSGTIGRATIKGTGINQTFIIGAEAPRVSRSTRSTSQHLRRHDRPRAPRRHRRQPELYHQRRPA